MFYKCATFAHMARDSVKYVCNKKHQNPTVLHDYSDNQNQKDRPSIKSNNGVSAKINAKANSTPKQYDTIDSLKDDTVNVRSTEIYGSESFN